MHQPAKSISHAGHPWPQVLGQSLLLVLALALIWTRTTAADGSTPIAPPRPEVHVYKQPTCGCCRTWIKYLEASGFPVSVTDTTALAEVRVKQGVPLPLAGCHTALVGGYVVEGHVSVSEIEYLLINRPAIKGLLVPGMPKGSPGMEGEVSERYQVLELHDDGSTTVHATHEGLTDPPDSSSSSAGVAPDAIPSPRDEVHAGE